MDKMSEFPKAIGDNPRDTGHKQNDLSGMLKSIQTAPHPPIWAQRAEGFQTSSDFGPFSWGRHVAGLWESAPPRWHSWEGRG